MARICAAALSFLWLFSSFALAAEEAEPPLQENMTGVWIFVVIAVLCVLWFGWYMWKNQKKPESEKEGEKF